MDVPVQAPASKLYNTDTVPGTSSEITIRSTSFAGVEADVFRTRTRATKNLPFARKVGWVVGAEVGESVGASDGSAVGLQVGTAVGAGVGRVGCSVGHPVG